ncbi:MAG: T9SS type A sorting domain-containing protein [Saprospiraceae bacterium]
MIKRYVFIIFSFACIYSLSAQNHITVEIVNKEIGIDNLSWTFDLQLTATATYITPNDQFTGVTVRFDAAVGSNIISGGSVSLVPTYAASGGVQISVPGSPPTGSSELGIQISRNSATNSDLPIGIPTIVGTFTINFSSPVDPSSLVTPRNLTDSSGSFWANSSAGSRPFNLPSAFPLPITIKTFTAVKDGERSARLDWTSSSEINSDYIDIERSTDGSDWITLGQVKAAGNSSTEVAYQYFDRNIPINRTDNQIFYYRLKLVDLDGKYTYSDLRGVNFEGTRSDGLALYPNPTAHLLNADLSGLNLSDGDILLKIYDNLGKVVLDKPILGAGIEPLDVSHLTGGTYNVSVTQGDIQFQKRFIKID